MKVLLIGCGQTGGAIASNLLKLSQINEIALYSRTIKSAKAIAFDLKNSKVEIIENLNKIKKYDYIIIALSGVSDSERKESISKRRTTYQVRQDELKYNLGAITGLIHYLKSLSKKTKIIIVTNPVDEITNYMQIILKNKNIFGFGLDLDCKRYSKFLKKDLLCVGTHGKAVPIINATSEKEYNILYKKIDSKLMDYIKRKGIPSEIAGRIFFEFFKKFISPKKGMVHISYYLKKKFYNVRGISISLPVYVQKGKVKEIAPIRLNDIERKRFQKSADQLKKSVNHILDTHKKLISYK